MLGLSISEYFQSTLSTIDSSKHKLKPEAMFPLGWDTKLLRDSNIRGAKTSE